MSVFFVVTPVLANMAWPVLSSAIASTLSTTGYNMVKQGALLGETCIQSEEKIELDLKNSEGLGETLGEEEKLTMEKEGFTLTFSKGKDDRCKVLVAGRGKTREELAQAGQEASNKILQAYAYGKVMEEAKKKGLKVVEEQNADGRIKLKFRKWS